MKKIFFLLISIGFIGQMYTQDMKLPEVIVSAVNYKYLNAVNSSDADMDVKQLEKMVAFYDIKESDLYADYYDNYTVEFYIPDGMIVAAYDKDGNILRTIEKFKSVKLPKDVRNHIFRRYPNWTLDKNVYHVTYNNEHAKKVYKIRLKNGDEVLRIKIDDEGNFL